MHVSISVNKASAAGLVYSLAVSGFSNVEIKIKVECTGMMT